MIDRRDLDELKTLGAGQPAPDEVARLYHHAFRDFGAQAFRPDHTWYRPPIELRLNSGDRLNFIPRPPHVRRFTVPVFLIAPAMQSDSPGG
jgi:hypothetical protein